MDIRDKQINELRTLSDGWMDGAGKAPDPDCLDWLSNWFLDNFPDDFPMNWIYPTPEGGIQAEWSLGDSEISLNIDIQNHTAVWHLLEMSTDKSEEKELDLDNIEDSKWVVERLTSLANYSTGKLDVLESWKLTAEELAKEVAQLEIENAHLKEEIEDLSDRLKESEKECQKLVQVFLAGIQEGDA